MKGLAEADILGELLHKEFFLAPCKCCGSGEHGVLMQDTLSNGKTKISLGCSVTKDDEWEQVVGRALKTVRIVPCIEKIADVYQYRVDRVNESMACFRKEGYGRYMDYMQLVDFENDLFKYCIEFRKEILFKRHQPLSDRNEADGMFDMDS